MYEILEDGIKYPYKSGDRVWFYYNDPEEKIYEGEIAHISYQDKMTSGGRVVDGLIKIKRFKHLVPLKFVSKTKEDLNTLITTTLNDQAEIL